MCLYPKMIKNPKYLPNKKNKNNPPKITDERVKYVPVGCGNCMECRKQKKREWQIRMNEEIKHDRTGKFITLTFSNEELDKLIQETGIQESNAVATIAVRRFLERWRKKYKKSVKHFLITELGHNGTERIHLHGILFTNEKTFGEGPLQLDGEIYHLDLTLQQILKRVKRVKGDRSDIIDYQLQYWIYDVVDQDKPFKNRYDFLAQQPLLQTNFLKPVETILLYSESDLIKFDTEARTTGFEGSMLRNPSGLYVPNYRSADLLKYKESTFKEEDYEVVGGISAKGKDEGSVVFICKLTTGEQFSVRPKGTLEHRRSMLKNIETYIGRKLTVRYAELTADGIPFHPVGLFFRDQYE